MAVLNQTRYVCGCGYRSDSLADATDHVLSTQHILDVAGRLLPNGGRPSQVRRFDRIAKKAEEARKAS